MDLKALWDALGTTGQAALCGALAGPLLSALQQVVTLSKLPGLHLDSSAYPRACRGHPQGLRGTGRAGGTSTQAPTRSIGGLTWTDY